MRRGEVGAKRVVGGNERFQCSRIVTFNPKATFILMDSGRSEFESRAARRFGQVWAMDYRGSSLIWCVQREKLGWRGCKLIIY